MDGVDSSMARIVKEQKERFEQMVPAGVRMAKEQQDRVERYSAGGLAAKEYMERNARLALSLVGPALKQYEAIERITGPVVRVALAQYEQFERLSRPLSRMLQEQQAVYDRVVAPMASVAAAKLAAFDSLIEKSGIAAHLKNLALVQQHFQRDYERLCESEKKTADSARNWSEALALVQTELPKRGWYLTGKEPAGASLVLAKHLQAGDWEAVDEFMVKQALRLRVDIDELAKWLAKHSVPDCCIKRVRLFIDYFKSKNHEAATLIGVPLIDELCRSLYEGRDFTSKTAHKPKRTKIHRPAIAEPKSDGTESVKRYAKGFLQQFGLFQDNWDETQFADDNYFNRHAILHGMMQRSYGTKDSAKAMMAIIFITAAFNEELN